MNGEAPTRKAERLQICGELVGEVMAQRPMAIREISRTGALIETSSPLLVDSLHDLRLRLGEISIVIKGRIVHSRISEVDHGGVLYTAGIEFIEPTPHAVDAIVEFMRRIAAPEV